MNNSTALFLGCCTWLLVSIFYILYLKLWLNEMCELSAQPSRGGFRFYDFVLQACQMRGSTPKPDGQCSTTHTREHEEMVCEAALSSALNRSKAAAPC